MSSILKTTALIKSIKRRGFIPENQKTFSAEDFLEIATEKININLMDQIITARGDYLVYSEDIALSEDVSSFAIPDRAIGNKLRNAVIVDANGNVARKLTQIEMEAADEIFTNFDPFYVQNNNIVLVNNNFSSGEKLRMYFYMRPNKLVVESRAATAAVISSSVEIDLVTPTTGTITEVSLTGVVTSANHGLTSGNKISITGSDSNPAVDGIYTISVIDSNSFSILATLTTPATTGSWSLASDVTIISSTLFPKHFTTDYSYDIVAAISPNRIKMYNLTPNTVNSTTKTISFRTCDLNESIVKGDYITVAEETIVPNVPTEYHPLIAQMVGVSCMESMADEQQKRSANDTLKEMEKAILRIVTNRVEGSPKKIKNRNSTLNQSINRRRR